MDIGCLPPNDRGCADDLNTYRGNVFMKPSYDEGLGYG